MIPYVRTITTVGSDNAINIQDPGTAAPNDRPAMKKRTITRRIGKIYSFQEPPANKGARTKKNHVNNPTKKAVP